MKGYGQFCPVAKAAEAVMGRWTPLVLRELLLGARRFSEIRRGVPLMPRSMLVQRLEELAAAGLIEATPRPDRRGHDYTLTEAGRALRPVVDALGDWGAAYTRHLLGPDDLDPVMLMDGIGRTVDRARLPAERTCLRFEFRNLPPRQRARRLWWLVLERDAEPDVCLKDPGFEVDLTVRADLAAMTRVWLGYEPLSAALRDGSISLDGARGLVREFPHWLALGRLRANTSAYLAA
jgi:DNA-binding HxlR family transcriptional regulator